MGIVDESNIKNIKYWNHQKKVKNNGTSTHVLTMNMCLYLMSFWQFPQK